MGDGSSFGKLDENISKGMKVEELSRRVLCNIGLNEAANLGKGDQGFLKSILYNYNRLVVDKFYVKLVVFG